MILIKVYTIPSCSYCDKVKELFKIVELEYLLIVVGRDVTKSQFQYLHPNAVGFPHVIINDEEIGGLQNVAKYLVDKGYGDKLRQR
tara:strand:- start:167 stop:424 length:258 start_codon:yes stop_codon:yes gene_type:complete